MAGADASPTRRRVLALLGATAAGGALAACTGSSGSGGGSGESSSSASSSASSASDEAAWFTASQLAVFGRDVSARRPGHFGATRVRLVRAAGTGSPALRVSYPKHSASQTSHRHDGTPDGGAQVYLPLRSGPQFSLYLRYRVRFEPGFAFVKGGKLPGLYGGSHTSGGRVPDGDDGLSTRLMWRTGGAGEVYAYLPSSKEHGTSIERGAFHFHPGRWTTVQQHVVMNHIGDHDGSIDLWIDGEHVISAPKLVFRDTKDLKIDGVFFSTFFGGDDSSWSSPRDQWAEFADFAVWREGEDAPSSS